MPSEELDDLAQALRALQPRTDLDRDQLMYAAGRAAASRGWLWPSLAGMASTVALVLGGFLLWQPEPKVRVQTVYVTVAVPVPVPVPGPSTQTPPAETITMTESEPFLGSSLPQPPMVRLEEQIARWGLDALPVLPSTYPNNDQGGISEMQKFYAPLPESLVPLR